MESTKLDFPTPLVGKAKLAFCFPCERSSCIVLGLNDSSSTASTSVPFMDILWPRSCTNYLTFRAREWNAAISPPHAIRVNPGTVSTVDPISNIEIKPFVISMPCKGHMDQGVLVCPRWFRDGHIAWYEAFDSDARARMKQSIAGPKTLSDELILKVDKSYRSDIVLIVFNNNEAPTLPFISISFFRTPVGIRLLGIAVRTARPFRIVTAEPLDYLISCAVHFQHR